MTKPIEHQKPCSTTEDSAPISSHIPKLLNTLSSGGPRPGVAYSKIETALDMIEFIWKERSSPEQFGHDLGPSFFDEVAVALASTLQDARREERSIHGRGAGTGYAETVAGLRRISFMCQSMIAKLQGTAASAAEGEIPASRSAVLARIERELLAPSRLSRPLQEQAESFGLPESFVQSIDPNTLVEVLRKMQLRYGASGASSEVGELHRLARSHIDMKQPFDADGWNEELGDMLFYIVFCARVGGTTLERIVDGQLEKLRRRFGGAWSAEKAIAKADKVVAQK